MAFPPSHVIAADHVLGAPNALGSPSTSDAYCPMAISTVSSSGCLHLILQWLFDRHCMSSFADLVLGVPNALGSLGSSDVHFVNGS